MSCAFKLVGVMEERTEDACPEAYVGLVVILKLAEPFIVKRMSEDRRIVIKYVYAPSTMKRMKGIETFAVRNSPNNV